MVGRFYLHIILLFFAVQTVQAQDEPEFTTSVNKTNVSLNERIQVTFELNDRGSRFRAPDLGNDFKIYSGPNQSTSMSYVNGRMSARMSFSYIIQPRRKGKLIIEPAEIEVDGKRLSSNAVEITVSGSKQQPKAGRQSKQRQAKSKQQAQQTENIFLKVEFSKNKVYRGEQFLAVYKLYTRHGVRGVDKQKLPDLTGFYSSTVEFEQGRPTREVYNGKQYDVYVLRKYILFPQRSGNLELDPIEFDLTIQVKDDEPVQTFFGPRYKMIDKKITLKSKPAAITVKPLPDPKPADFTGAVGKLNYSSSIDRATAKTDESITLNYKISGSGNINLLEHPNHALPVEFEVYDPKVNVSKTEKKTTLSGTKTWEYLMIPRNPGEYEIKTPSFSYFNTTKEKYETISGNEFQISVTGDTSSASAGNTRARTKREVEQLDSDIRFIMTDEPDFTEKNRNPFQSAGLWIMMILPCLIGAGFVVYLRRNAELRADVAAYRKHRATKIASKKLKAAKKLLDRGESEAFYEELYRGLNDYLSDKLTIPKSEMTAQTITAKMEKAHIAQETIQEVKEIIEACEMARFAPSSRESEKDLYQKAVKVIKNTEHTLK